MEPHSNPLQQESSSLSLKKFFFLLCPIFRHELKIFLPMALMHVLIIFNFWIVHNLKDSMVIGTVESGAEVINFLKVWAVFPLSLIFVVVYTVLSNQYSQRRIFTAIILFFLSFYALYAFVLYPYGESLNMSVDAIRTLKLNYPNVQWFFPMIGYWTNSLFYVFSEMWAAIVLTLLFWQFANQITPVEQAKRFYMMYGAISALGILFSGLLTKYVTSCVPCHFTDTEAWNYTISILLYVFILNCFLIIICYWCINIFSVEESMRYRRKKTVEDSKQQEKTIKLSLWESIKHIIRSRYIGFIALIAIGYNLSMNIIEVTWKSELGSVFQTNLKINAFMADFNIYLAPITFITGVVGANIVRKFSWYTSAMITPIIMLLLGSLFFALIMLQKFNGDFQTYGIEIARIAIYIGLLQNLLARSSKFCFFNATREMAYIPLDAELKVKGKAAVDVLSGRVGKLGGATIQQALLFLVPGRTQLAISPYLSGILLLIIILWMYSVSILNKKFIALLKATKNSGK